MNIIEDTKNLNHGFDSMVEVGLAAVQAQHELISEYERLDYERDIRYGLKEGPSDPKYLDIGNEPLNAIHNSIYGHLASVALIARRCLQPTEPLYQGLIDEVLSGEREIAASVPKTESDSGPKEHEVVIDVRERTVSYNGVSHVVRSKKLAFTGEVLRCIASSDKEVGVTSNQIAVQLGFLESSGDTFKAEPGSEGSSFYQQLMTAIIRTIPSIEGRIGERLVEKRIGVSNIYTYHPTRPIRVEVVDNDKTSQPEEQR